jgi:hypothetical protein
VEEEGKGQILPHVPTVKEGQPGRGSMPGLHGYPCCVTLALTWLGPISVHKSLPQQVKCTELWLGQSLSQ